MFAITIIISSITHSDAAAVTKDLTKLFVSAWKGQAETKSWSGFLRLRKQGFHIHHPCLHRHGNQLRQHLRHPDRNVGDPPFNVNDKALPPAQAQERRLKSFEWPNANFMICWGRV